MLRFHSAIHGDSLSLRDLNKMTIGVILIGFNYTGQDKQLPGTCVDIFRTHEFFSGLIQSVNHVVITDIAVAPRNADLIAPVIDGIVDHRILDFFPRLLLTKHYKYCFSRRDLERQVKDFLTPEMSRVVVYYSGHAVSGKLLLPSGESLEELESLVGRSVQGLFIFDCCSYNIVHPVGYNKLFLVSSKEGSDTASTNIGSIFTKHIFEALGKTRVLTELTKWFESQASSDRVRGVRDKELTSLTVYRAHDGPESLWDWCFGECFTVIHYKGIDILLDVRVSTWEL